MPRDQLILCGHLDGFALQFDGVNVEVFDSYLAAITGMRIARVAQFLLAATLARKDA